MIIKKRVPLVAFQTAMYALLTAGQTTPVYDDVPEDAVLPYVTFGGFTAKQSGTKTTNCWDISQQIHIWSEYQGKKEVNSIADDVSTVLSSVMLDLSAAGFKVIAQDVDFCEAWEEDDGGYHMAITFVAKVQDLGGK